VALSKDVVIAEAPGDGNSHGARRCMKVLLGHARSSRKDWLQAMMIKRYGDARLAGVENSFHASVMETA